MLTTKAKSRKGEESNKQNHREANILEAI